MGAVSDSYILLSSHNGSGMCLKSKQVLVSLLSAGPSPGTRNIVINIPCHMMMVFPEIMRRKVMEREAGQCEDKKERNEKP